MCTSKVRTCIPASRSSQLWQSWLKSARLWTSASALQLQSEKDLMKHEKQEYKPRIAFETPKQLEEAAAASKAWQLGLRKDTEIEGVRTSQPHRLRRLLATSQRLCWWLRCMLQNQMPFNMNRNSCEPTHRSNNLNKATCSTTAGIIFLCTVAASMDLVWQ